MNLLVKVFRLVKDPVTGLFDLDPATPYEDVPALKVSSASPVKKFLEEGAAEFRIGEFTCELQGLTENDFADFTRSTPYIGEVQYGTAWDAVDSRCVFYGPVEPGSVRFNQGTGLVSLTILSWDGMLKDHPEIQARSRWETQFSRSWRAGFGIEAGGYWVDVWGGGIWLYRYWVGASRVNRRMSVYANPELLEDLKPGATIITRGVINGADIEYRAVVSGPIELELSGAVATFGVSSGEDDRLTFGPVDSMYMLNYLRTGRSDPILEFIMPNNVFAGDEDLMVGRVLEFDLGGTGQDPFISEVTEVEYVTRTLNLDVFRKVFGRDPVDITERLSALVRKIVTKEYPNQQQRNAFLVGDPEYNTSSGAFWPFLVHDAVRVDSGTDVTILGPTAYGEGGEYLPGVTDLVPREFDAVQVITGLLNRVEILGSFTVAPVVRGSLMPLSRLYDFDEDPSQALSDIQRSSECFIEFEPSVDNRSPRGLRVVKPIIRTRASIRVDGASNSIAMANPIVWEGEAVGEKPLRVVVESDPINQPIFDDQSFLGVYPLEKDDVISLILKGKVEDRNTINLEVPLVVPSIDYWSVVRLNRFRINKRLSGYARRYFEWYARFYRKQTVEFAGIFDYAGQTPVSSGGVQYFESFLGKKVSHTGELKTGLVLSQSVDYVNQRTSFELIVTEPGDFVEPENLPPVARITVIDRTEATPQGEADFVFDGSTSYDPNGDTLTFAWSIRRVGDPEFTAAGTARTLEGSFYSGDEVRLRVTDPEGLFDEVTAILRFDPGDRIPYNPDTAPPMLEVDLDRIGSQFPERFQRFRVRAFKPGAVVNIYYTVFRGPLPVVYDVGASTWDPVGNPDGIIAPVTAQWPMNETGDLEVLIDVPRPDPALGLPNEFRVWATDTASDRYIQTDVSLFLVEAPPPAEVTKNVVSQRVVTIMQGGIYVHKNIVNAVYECSDNATGADIVLQQVFLGGLIVDRITEANQAPSGVFEFDLTGLPVDAPYRVKVTPHETVNGIRFDGIASIVQAERAAFEPLVISSFVSGSPIEGQTVMAWTHGANAARMWRGVGVARAMTPGVTETRFYISLMAPNGFEQLLGEVVFAPEANTGQFIKYLDEQIGEGSSIYIYAQQVGSLVDVTFSLALEAI
jgi:hypothetical protein